MTWHEQQKSAAHPDEMHIGCILFFEGKENWGAVSLGAEVLEVCC
jgi:hypothetical protein